MPDLTNARTEQEIPHPGQVGVVITAPATIADSFTVTVADFSGDHFYEITRWMPRGEVLPAEGDETLIVKDENGEPWCVAWWPG